MSFPFRIGVVFFAIVLTVTSTGNTPAPSQDASSRLVDLWDSQDLSLHIKTVEPESATGETQFACDWDMHNTDTRLSKECYRGYLWADGTILIRLDNDNELSAKFRCNTMKGEWYNSSNRVGIELRRKTPLPTCE
jgi:hypothetical protein